MEHHICRGGCGGRSDQPGKCQSGDCPNHDKSLESCDCQDGQHGQEAKEEVKPPSDSEGTPDAPTDQGNQEQAPSTGSGQAPPEAEKTE